MMFRLIICLWKSQIQVQSMRGTRASGLRVCPLCTYFVGLKTAELRRTRPDGHNSGRTSSSAVGCYGTEGVRARVRATTATQTKPLYSANSTMQTTLRLKNLFFKFFWVAKVWNMYHVLLLIKFAKWKKKTNKQTNKMTEAAIDARCILSL